MESHILNQMMCLFEEQISKPFSSKREWLTKCQEIENRQLLWEDQEEDTEGAFEEVIEVEETIEEEEISEGEGIIMDEEIEEVTQSLEARRVLNIKIIFSFSSSVQIHLNLKVQCIWVEF